MNRQIDTTQQPFYLKPISAQHLENIADWYQDIDELALIESNLPLPINPQSLEKIWQRDIEPKEPRTSYIYAICDAEDEAVGFTGLQDINFIYGSGVVFIFCSDQAEFLRWSLRQTALNEFVACRARYFEWQMWNCLPSDGTSVGSHNNLKSVRDYSYAHMKLLGQLASYFLQ